MSTPSLAALDYLLPYQRRAIEDPARFTHDVWSRQVGKSTTKSLRRIWRGIQRGRDQLFLSSSAQQSRELMGKARQHLEALKIAFQFSEAVDWDDEHVKFTTMEFRLPAALGGIRIIGLPANPRTARGFAGDLLLDEFSAQQNDREIWAAAYPSVLRCEGELDIAGTPKGRSGTFYGLHNNREFSHHTVTIDDAIADGLHVDREALRRGLGDDELWRQEFLCEFVDEATAFITYEMIFQCEDDKLARELDIESLKEHRGEVVVGVDIGRKHDLTVIWAFDLIGSTMISRGLIELDSIPFRQQFEVLCQVLDCRCIRRCCIDSTGLGMQLAEQAVERFGGYAVEACPFTPKLKEAIGGQIRTRMEDRRMRIPVCEKIRNDLHSIRKNVTAAGNIRLEAPREDGSHADRFYAAALACHAASDGGGRIEGQTSQPLVSAGLRDW